MDVFVITKEMLENAVDYLPLGQKTALAKQQAEICVQRSSDQTGIRADSGDIIPLPPRYNVDEAVRSILEMSIFTALYLRCEPIESDNITMDAERYDYYAGNHIFGQLTSMKSGTFGRDNPELKNKIINMLADFNDYQKRLTSEIRAVMTMYNDPVDRFMAMNAAMTNPDTMKGLLSELKEAAEAVEEYKAERTEAFADDSGNQPDVSV